MTRIQKARKLLMAGTYSSPITMQEVSNQLGGYTFYDLANTLVEKEKLKKRSVNGWTCYYDARTEPVVETEPQVERRDSSNVDVSELVRKVLQQQG